MNASISACARNSAWQLSLWLFNQAGHTQQQHQTAAYQHLFSALLPDSYSFNAVISSCVYGAVWQTALTYLHRAQQSGLPKKPVILTAASSACAIALKWQIALELASLSCAVVKSNDRQGALVSLGATLKACERGAQWSLACHTAWEALRTGLVDSSACCAAVSACEKSQQWQHALSLSSSLVANLVKPNALLCGAVVSSCEYSREWELAMQLLHSTELGGGPQVFQDLSDTASGSIMPVAAAMSCCSKANRWELVLHLLDRLRHSGVPAGPVATAAALEACSRGTRWQYADLLLNILQAQSASRRVREAEAGTLVGLESALSALDHCGQFPRAIQWRGLLQRFQPVLGLEPLEYTVPSRNARQAQKSWQPSTAEWMEERVLIFARKLPRRRHPSLQLLAAARHMLAKMRM